MTRRLIDVAVLLSTSVVVAGCGGSDRATAPAAEQIITDGLRRDGHDVREVSCALKSESEAKCIAETTNDGVEVRSAIDATLGTKGEVVWVATASSAPSAVADEARDAASDQIESAINDASVEECVAASIATRAECERALNP